MNSDIALFLLQDGVINASIYAVLALALILVFTVTRIIYVPQGEFVSYGALTLAVMQQGLFPATVYVTVALGIIAAAYEVIGSIRARHRPDRSKLILFLVYPAILWAFVKAVDPRLLGLLGQIVLTFAIVVPIGPMIYRIVFQPISDATILVLLIASVAVHLVMVGLGLLVFGPEGSRTIALSDATIELGPITISGQSLLILGLCISLMIMLAWAFSETLFGKALKATAVNRAGARIVGIRPQMAGQLCFALAAVVGVLSGILISPLTTMYYDSGFIVALKGFVAAIIGGLVSYPIAAAGALFLGILEAFASFWTSAYREVIVFSVIIPVLLFRSLTSKHAVEDE